MVLRNGRCGFDRIVFVRASDRAEDGKSLAENHASHSTIHSGPLRCRVGNSFLQNTLILDFRYFLILTSAKTIYSPTFNPKTWIVPSGYYSKKDSSQRVKFKSDMLLKVQYQNTSISRFVYIYYYYCNPRAIQKSRSKISGDNFESNRSEIEIILRRWCFE